MSFAIGAIIGGAIMVAGGIAKGVAAKNQAKRERNRARTAEQKLEELERGRQDVVNPYANMQDLSGMITNPYANMQVATRAAELQGEEADISLASTLDTLRATGAGAGGATALAQASLRSKLGISANIQQQEAQNARMRAQGQAQMNQQRMAEAQRMQQGDISGRQFMFQAQEQRDVMQLNRLAGLQQGHMQAEAAYKGAAIGAIGDTAGAIGGTLMGMSNPGSDIRLKKNIKLIGLSSSGLRIYAFEYIDKMFGKGIWQGVMSDEIPQNAVIKHKDGYDRVDYSKLDVEFKQIKL
tara:strand:+ start:1220 stop:2107 length:888 start_codon:yes stop_codon:yes gene_type:complete